MIDMLVLNNLVNPVKSPKCKNISGWFPCYR